MDFGRACNIRPNMPALSSTTASAAPQWSQHVARRKARRAVVRKRFALLAAICAVPAFGASGGFAGSTLPDENFEPIVMPLPFERAEDNFPGSAFYYLEDAPQLSAASEPASAEAGTEADIGSEMPIAARSWHVGGSDSDQARAQQCMAMAIHYEAASESDAGMRAVAQVIMNRVAHPAFPNNVCGVVFQGSARSTGCQFSFTCDGSMTRRAGPSGVSRSARIAREALAGAVYAPAGLATHYHTLAVKPYWAPSLSQIGVVGSHIFYRWRGNAGTPAAFSASYSGAEPLPRRNARLPEAPDPIAPPPVFTAAPAATSAAAVPLAARNHAAPVASPAPNNVLPAGGGVRSEYARSGQWIKQP